jgi:two-component system sensor histidine kinase PhoQ
MKRISLRKRFFVNSAFVVIAVILLAVVLIDIRYSHELEVSEQQKLKLHIFNLLSVSDFTEGQISLPLLLANPNFNTPDSDLWAAVLNAEGDVLWQSLSIENLPPGLPALPNTGDWGYHQVNVSNSRFFTTSYGVRWALDSESANGEPDPIFHLIVAQLSQQYDSAILSFRIWLVLGALAFALTLLSIQFYVLKFSFKPIKALGDEIKKMESGEQSKLQQSYPLELASVTGNLNLLIDKEYKQREKYRLAMADLAHSLKTPLSIIKAELDHHSHNATLSNALARLNQTIEYQLRRSVIAGHHLLAQGTNVATTLNMVLLALEKINRDAGIQVTTSIDADCVFMGDENDLLEIFGNLIDNAFKHAKSQIVIKATQQNACLSIYIEDDGLGVPQQQAKDIFKRGSRLDESKQGQGIGLSIVENIVSSYDGTIDLERSELGGALFIIHFHSKRQGSTL